MPDQFHTLRNAFSVAAVILSMTGCQPAMSTQPDHAHKNPNESAMFPLKFGNHDFQAYCFNTLTCKVVYNNHNFTRFFTSKPSGPPPTPDYREHWPFASYLGIRNFPPPAEVQWTSMDGVEHEAKVDIGEIFKGERVLYNVPDSEIPDRSWGGEPGIILEVNDKTISVYMKAFIATKTEQIPGNKYSYGREDVIQAWAHTY